MKHCKCREYTECIPIIKFRIYVYPTCACVGFAGENEIEQAKVDMIIETMEDLIKPLAGLRTETDEEKKVSSTYKDSCIFKCSGPSC